MSDRDDKLRQAILELLPDDAGPQDWLADVIMAAVNAVLQESEKVTWGVRCIKTGRCLHFSPGPHIFSSREAAEAYVGKAGLGVHELARLRSWRGLWEEVP